MTTIVNRKADFLRNESILIDSHNESNRFESRIGMLYSLLCPWTPLGDCSVQTHIPWLRY